MTVPVNSMQRNRFTPAVVQPGHLFDHRPISPRTLGWQKAALFQERQRLQHRARAIEPLSVFRFRRRPHVVDTRQQPSQDLQLLVRELVGRAPPGPSPDGVVDALHLVQGLTIRERQRSANRDLGFPQLGQETMLVENGSRTPAPGPVELHHHVVAGLEPQVVDPVLETRERRDVAGGLEASRLDRFQDPVGCQLEEEVGHGSRV